LSLLHGSAYYTLNNIPSGEKANITLVTPKTRAERERIDAGTNANTPDNQMKEAMPTTAGVAGVAKGKGTSKTTAVTSNVVKESIISDAEATKLLTKHTCLACHKVGERAVGPSYKDVAKRKYTNEQIEALIIEPKPENWPDFATPMAPMSHVPKGDIKKIAAWINALGKK
jgi:cytochrome c551/c552